MRIFVENKITVGNPSHSNSVIPIPMTHSPSLSFPRESHETHWIPVDPIPMHISSAERQTDTHTERMNALLPRLSSAWVIIIIIIINSWLSLKPANTVVSNYMDLLVTRVNSVNTNESNYIGYGE